MTHLPSCLPSSRLTILIAIKIVCASDNEKTTAITVHHEDSQQELEGYFIKLF